MANLNRVYLMGNLTRDPELRYTPSGTAVTNLGIAVNSRYKTKTGELKEETAFITVVVWGKQAETCSQYLGKGRAIFAEGRLQMRSWETPDGQKRNILQVIAARIQFLDKAQAPAPTQAAEGLPAQAQDETLEALLNEDGQNASSAGSGGAEGSQPSPEVPF